MRSLWLLAISAFILGSTAEAKEVWKGQSYLREDSGGESGDLTVPGLMGVAQAGTTWIGWIPGAYDPVTNPHSIGTGGYWDFDDGGSRPCPVEDNFQEYIKNGAYAQGWTSEDVLAQKGLYWRPEDFSDPGFACQGNAALNGTYSAWCGIVNPDPSICFTNPAGYGHNWSQWMCRTVKNPVGLTYTFKSNTEPGFDYAYVFIDKEFPDSCGWVGPGADTLRCYDGANGPTTEVFDLTNLPGGDPDFCEDGVTTTPDYSGDTVKVCFVVISDAGWDDQDGQYVTCDGAFTVDDIIVTTSAGADTTTFESGALDDWTVCGGFSPGDYVAIRHRSSILVNDVCGYDNCAMSECVLTFFNPDIPGQYGTGGHYAGDMHKRAWSPTINLSNHPQRGYVTFYSRSVDLPISNWIFLRYWARYVQDPDCPTGAWSRPVTWGYIYYMSYPGCDERVSGFSHYVPADADSVQIGYSIWNGCNIWETTCTNGNDSPAIDNVRLGIFDLSYPLANIRSVDNYCDAFPENETLGDFPSANTALIDAANNRSQEGYFLRLSDTAVVALDLPDVKMDFCFRVVPGPGTDTGDPWFVKYGEGGLAGCDMTQMHCTRMDTCFSAGNGVSGDPLEFQKVYDGYFATMIHEEDPLYVAEGEEILSDSLFTPGSKIFYAFRSSYLTGPGPYSWLPFGADPTGTDVSSWYEVMVLPDQCKDPLTCLLYVDYYNRGAQAHIESALAMLGRTWDRFDLRAESSHQGNGIGNRLLGPGRYRLARGPIGPSLDHLAQYKVMLVNNGNFGIGVGFSDGGTGTPDDPTNDITFLDNWLSEGPHKGLWLSGNNIATDFSQASTGPKPGFLSRELATTLVSPSYRDLTGHPIDENCRLLFSRGGKVVNTYSMLDSLSLTGSGCPQRYEFDVIEERDGESGREFVSLMYDRTDLTHPPGYYASVDHVFRAPNAPFDTVRTKIDGFSMHNLRMSNPPCAGADNIMVALWMRDVLGGVVNSGYFYDNDLELQYCPPVGAETIDVPGGPGRTYLNALFQNYPNPFRGGAGTTIHYAVTKVGRVKIRVFDAAGRLVRSLSDEGEPGDNFVHWDGKGASGRAVASGVYFYQIKKDGFTDHKKMLLVR